MPNAQSHSPLPWRPVDFGGIYDARNDTVVGCALYEPNAVLIVRAVNAHQALVTALEACITRLEGLDKRLLAITGNKAECELGEVTAARAALALAKGEA